MVSEKSKYKKKSIYFNKENLDIFEYLKTKSDASDYICKLIRADLGMETEEVDMSLLLSELKKLNNKVDNLKIINVSDAGKDTQLRVAEEETESENEEYDDEPMFDPLDILNGFK